MRQLWELRVIEHLGWDSNVLFFHLQFFRSPSLLGFDVWFFVISWRDSFSFLWVFDYKSWELDRFYYDAELAAQGFNVGKISGSKEFLGNKNWLPSVQNGF